MRLIDADELSKWISGQIKSPSCPKNESAFGLRIMKHIDRMLSAQSTHTDTSNTLKSLDCVDTDIANRVKDMPTIKPERKTGKWIPMFNGAFKGGAYWFECSECKRIVPEVRNGGWGYCPNCGADMREEQE